MDLKEKRSEMLDSYSELTAELDEVRAKERSISNNVMRLQGAIALLNEQIGDVLVELEEEGEI